MLASMTQIALAPPRTGASTSGLALFPAAIFGSAALVFLVEPMMGRLTLPLLGGGPGVWNTTLAFFQVALLIGYLYAHALQRVRSVGRQAVIHVGVLAAAGAVLPLHLSEALGPPPVHAPAAWLLGVLMLSVGAPFAALSATAPLLQAWLARTSGSGKVYGLYAASNLGSLSALVAYPLLVEPGLALADQRAFWTCGYLAFVVLASGVALVAARRAAAATPVDPIRQAPAAAGRWRERAAWVLLAAAPSSLMMGATAHLSSDIGSLPLLWAVPLGLYLLTFILAFREGGERSGALSLDLQAVAILACTAALPIVALGWTVQLTLNVAAFFLTALVCHRALYGRRPAPARLTEFYLLVSVGGVLGGAFNAFVAPVVFEQVWEYPLVLVLACLARPAAAVRGFDGRERATWTAGMLATAAVALMGALHATPTAAVLLGAGIAAGAAWLLRRRPLAFTSLAAAWTVAVQVLLANPGGVHAERSFFGVHRVLTDAAHEPAPLRRLMHGSTLHGAERLSGPAHCTPMTYYGPGAPISEAFALLHARKPAAAIGAVGLGAGSVAALTRPGDRLRFFEIDPAVVRIARDEHLFDFVGPCARGRIDYTLGDGRLLLARAPAASYDLLLVDAFSSDSVPAHLLTTDALRVYLRALKPDGVLVMHLTNRNLRLMEPAAAAVREVGAVQRVRVFDAPKAAQPGVESSTAMAVARDPQALKAFAEAGWRPVDAAGTAAWTDDYLNLPGALVERMRRGPDKPIPVER